MTNRNRGFKPPPLPGQTTNRALKLLGCVGLLVILVPLLGLGIWFVSKRRATNTTIQKLENAARQRGEPLTLADLKAKYAQLPDDQNAALALIALWRPEDPELWDAFLNGERPLPRPVQKTFDPALPYLGADTMRVPRGLLTTNALRAAEQFLAERGEHLAVVAAALTNNRARFPVDFDAGPLLQLPHLARLKLEAHSFSIAALMAGERGAVPLALTHLKNITRVGQTVADEPLLISQMVRLACYNSVFEGAEQLLSRQTGSVETLEQLKELFNELELRGAARTVLVNERALALALFDPDFMALAVTQNNEADEAVHEMETNPEQVRNGLAVINKVGLLKADRKLLLETIETAVALAEAGTPEALKRTRALFDELEVKSRKFPPKIISGMTLPPLGIVADQFATLEARRRAALVALAVEQYRLQHNGQLPEHLKELTPDFLPALPLDPFDGAELRYRKLERGFVVYSVGKDLGDDGGRETSQRGKMIRSWDVTFVIER